LEDKTYQLIVKDIQGREKFRQTIHLDSEISIQHLAEGIYFIGLVQDGELIGQKKLIKIK
jgi:hypothetical protein